MPYISVSNFYLKWTMCFHFAATLYVYFDMAAGSRSGQLWRGLSSRKVCVEFAQLHHLQGQLFTLFLVSCTFLVPSSIN